MEAIPLILVLLTMLVAMALLALVIYRTFRSRKTVKERSTTLLSSVEEVFKLVTVEGSYSEVLEYREKHRVFFDLIPQENRALVIVRGKVLMGMDMKRAEFTADEGTGTITLTSIPEPEIIGLDTDVEYYDMRSSMLKKFDATELTKLQERAKTVISDKAVEGHLQLSAEKQAAQVVEVMRALIERAGWRFEIAPKAQKLLDGK